MAKSTLRILILTKSIDGGTGTFLKSLQKLQRYSDRDVKICNTTLEKPLFRKSEFKNLNCIGGNSYPLKYSMTSYSPFSFLREIYRLNSLVKSFDPQIAIGIDVHANILLSISKYVGQYSGPLILTTHIDLKETLKAKSSLVISFIMSLIVRFFYKRADILVSTCLQLSKRLEKDFGLNKVHPVSYGLDKMPNQAIRRPHKSPRILTVSRLVEQKDIKTLISAFKDILHVFPKAHLSIVGDGPLKRSLEKYCKSLKIDRSVTFKGWLKNVNEEISKNDIFVLTSKREGFGYVILEAMSHGLPVVVTNAPFGPSEILENGKSGILIKVGDVEGISKGVIDLLNDKNKYLKYSEASYMRAKYYLESKMLKKYVSLIESVI